MQEKTIQLEFNDVSSEVTFEHPEFGEIGVEVATYEFADDGIGPYECHGFKGNDSRPYVDPTDIMVVSVNGECFDTRKHMHIEKAVADMWQNGKIEATILEMPDEPDYPDDEPEDYDGHAEFLHERAAGDNPFGSGTEE